MLQTAPATILKASLSGPKSYDMLAAPAVVIFADDPARRARFARLAGEQGARVVGELSLASALSRLKMQAAGHIVIDLDSGTGSDVAAVLASLEELPPPGVTIVVAADAVGLVLDHDRLGAEVLVDPGDDELLAEFGVALYPPLPFLNDGAIETSGRRLQDLREELGRIARTLTTLSGSIEVEQRIGIERNGASARAAAARAEIRQRRLRGQYFDAELFADPAWDILLDLAAAENERRRVAVSSLCIAAAVPPTTALRWITQMTEQELLVRQPDPDDRRRVFIALSDPSRLAMDSYLDAVAAISRK